MDRRPFKHSVKGFIKILLYFQLLKFSAASSFLGNDFDLVVQMIPWSHGGGGVIGALKHPKKFCIKWFTLIKVDTFP